MAIVFQTAMTSMLRFMPGVLYYQDGVFVCGNMRSEHDERVDSVLEKFREYGLTVKAGKDKFG